MRGVKKTSTVNGQSRSPASRLLRTSFPHRYAIRRGSHVRMRTAVDTSYAADPRTPAYPSIRHPPQIPAYARVPRPSSAADPGVRTRTPSIRHPPQIPCRSALAREYVGSGDVNGAGGLCSSAITPKTVCTQGSWFRPSRGSQSPPAPAAPDAAHPPAPPGPPPPVHLPSRGCGSGTSKYSTAPPAC